MISIMFYFPIYVGLSFLLYNKLISAFVCIWKAKMIKKDDNSDDQYGTKYFGGFCDTTPFNPYVDDDKTRIATYVGKILEMDKE